MKTTIKMSLATALVMSVGTVSVQAEDSMSVLSDIKFKGELRPRYEYQDGSQNAGQDALDAGHVLTNRTNLNIEAKLLEVDGLKATVELNSVNDFSTLDQSSQVAGTEAAVAKVSQANIAYTSGDTTGMIGRKTLNLDNQRFIGSVGWKQNFQTLDLAAVAYNKDSLSVIGAYVYGVNAIGDAGNDTEGDIYGGGTASGETSSAVLNVGYKVADELKVTGYAYLLGSHSDTYGVALTGKAPLSEGVKLNYRAEYAMQTDASLETKSAGKPKNDSSYINLDVNTNIEGILLGLNYELLGADETTGTGIGGFQTALATKHKFNGFADQFLGTPGAGLQDLNLMVGYKAVGFGTAKAIYHTFDSDKGSVNYGSELDLLYANKIASFKGVTGLLKAAFYSGGDLAGGKSNDVTKIWAMLDYKFSI